MPVSPISNGLNIFYFNRSLKINFNNSNFLNLLGEYPFGGGFRRD